MGEVLGAEVEDASGQALGPVLDVRLVQDGPLRGTHAALRVDAIVVGGSAFGVRLGVVRSGIKGPWAIVTLLRRLERRSHVFAWRDVASVADGRVVLREGATPIDM
jgi:hypothetical protein